MRDTAVQPSSDTRPDVPAAPPAPEPQSAVQSEGELVEADLLVEDVSIDGMCGVY